MYAVFPVPSIPRGLLAENRRYELEASYDGCSLPAEWEITLNEVVVDRFVRQRRTIFPFAIGFYAGDLRVAVVDGDRILAFSDIEVDPDISKLTRDQYSAMVGDIARSTTALYRFGELTLPAPTQAIGFRSEVVTLDLIRSNFDVFERAVHRVADQPTRLLRSTGVTVDILHARRIDDHAINAALRSGRSRQATAAEVQAANRLVGALGGRWIPSLKDIRREECLDLYENRALLGFIQWLDSTLEGLARRIAAAQYVSFSAVAAVWAHRIARWRQRLWKLTRRALFGDLTPDPSLHATSIFRQNPDYALAFSAMARIRAGLGAGTSVTPAVPIDRTYSLYEMWCYIEFLHAVATLFPHVQSAIHSLLTGLRTPSLLGVVLAQGDAARLALKENLFLTYHRRFGVSPDAEGVRTLVVESIPDITLSKTDAAGRCSGLVVIDPKYRSGASLLDGIRDLHVYRDSIVDANNRRLVKGAVALAPRLGNIADGGDCIPDDRPIGYVARPGQSQHQFTRLLELATRALQ